MLIQAKSPIAAAAITIALLFAASVPASAQRWSVMPIAISKRHRAVTVAEVITGSLIPQLRFRTGFGLHSTFRIDPQLFLGGFRQFQFGGVSFGISRPWPKGWRANDDVYVDNVDGSYMLCNRRKPDLRMPITVENCESCGVPPVTDGVPTLLPGQSIAEVVAVLGSPTQIISLGAKQIHLYPNMKVVFLDGRMVEAI